MPLVSVITVNYNHNHVTEELLASIFKNKQIELEIIVVDNGSTLNPVPDWSIKYPGVKFIRSEVNLGFAGGNNLGIQKAIGEYLFLVNNDTEFTEGLVEQLYSTMIKNPQIGLLSPKIRYFYNPTLLQYAGFTEMNYFTGRNKCIGEFERDENQYNHLTGKTGFIHGAAMMVNRKALEETGLMSEVFFLYYEELDWCERFKKANYEIWIDMQALILHKESKSVGKNSAVKEYFMNRNRMLFISRNATLLQRSIFYIYFILIVTPRNIISHIKDKNFTYIIILFKAIWWNINHKAFIPFTETPKNKV